MDNFKRIPGTDSAVASCERFMSGSIIGSVLIGPPGRGKTHLMVATIFGMDSNPKIEITGREASISSRGKKIVYMPQYDLARLLRHEVMSGSRETMSSCIDADVLALDDLGVGGDITPFLTESVEYIIDSRYKNELQTMITTNLKLQEISRTFGQRVVSRIVECYDVVEITSEKDYRLLKAVGDG